MADITTATTESSQSNLQPSISHPSLPANVPNVHPNNASTTSPESSVSPESAFDYHRHKRLGKLPKVCPFSDPSRENPCTTHNQPRSRKDIIMKHLLKMKSKNDPSHPKNDPLWESDVVKYLLQLLPPRYDETQKREAAQLSAHRYYVKRIKLQDEKADLEKEKFIAGQIDAEKYKSFLIGKRRREFLMEQSLKARIEQEIREENERELQQILEQRISELRSQSNGDFATQSAILELENARDKLAGAQMDVCRYREEISSQSAKVVEFFANDSFLSSDRTFLQHHEFRWPTNPSVEIFYVFATFLSAPSGWNGQIRSSENIRHMKRELSEYIEGEKALVDEDEVHQLEGIMAVFNSSCDMVRLEEERTSEMSTEGAQKWLDEQSSLWDRAQRLFHDRFKLNTRPPIQLVSLIDEYADMWRGLKEAEDGEDLARQTAQAAAEGG